MELVKKLEYGSVYKMDNGENYYVRRNIDAKKHFMRKMKAYGVQETDVLLMKRYRVVGIVLCLKNKNNMVVNYDDFVSNAKKANFGHGDQLFLAQSNSLWDRFKGNLE